MCNARRRLLVRTAAASRFLTMRSARIHARCQCSMSRGTWARTRLGRVLAWLLKGLNWNGASVEKRCGNEKGLHSRKFVLQITGDRHLLDAVDALTNRFLVQGDGILFPPYLERWLGEEDAQQGVVLDNWVIANFPMSARKMLAGV